MTAADMAVIVFFRFIVVPPFLLAIQKTGKALSLPVKIF